MGACLRKKKKPEEGAEGEAGGGPKGAGDFFKKLGKKKRKSEETSAAYYVENKQDFTTQLKNAGDKIVVVDFYATWCGPCKMVKPQIEEMAAKMKNEDVIFMKVDVDECEEITTDYGISSMPTFVLIKNSEKVDEMTGVNLEKLKELIGNAKEKQSIKPKTEPSATEPSTTSNIPAN